MSSTISLSSARDHHDTTQYQAVHHIYMKLAHCAFILSAIHYLRQPQTGWSGTAAYIFFGFQLIPNFILRSSHQSLQLPTLPALELVDAILSPLASAPGVHAQLKCSMPCTSCTSGISALPLARPSLSQLLTLPYLPTSTLSSACITPSGVTLAH